MSPIKTGTRNGRRLDWTDWMSYAYLLVGLFMMFGPVLWLVASFLQNRRR